MQDGPSGRIGPLTPYQRPLVILLFLVVPLGVLGVVASYLVTGEWFFDRFRYKKYETPEVSHTTTEAATSANDLLLEFNRKLKDFDSQVQNIFGLDHYWHDPLNKPAPEMINKFVYETGDTDFLKKYNQIAIDRNELESKLNQLESKVDGSVTGLSETAKADHILQADRLVQKEIYNAFKDLETTQKRIDEISGKYKNRANQ